MAYLPGCIHDNSSNMSVRQINRFHGYNHNKVIADYEFYDMENMSGVDYPALTVRNGRSYYDWNEVKSAFIGSLRTVFYVSYEAVYKIVSLLPSSSAHGMSFEQYLKSRNLEFLLTDKSYEEHLKTVNPELIETYFSGNYNGSIDFDGLLVVMGSYVYYKSMIICEVTDCRKIIVPIGDKIAIFPDKIVIDMVKVNKASTELSLNVNNQSNDSDMKNILDEFYALCLKTFKPYIIPIEAKHNYVGTGTDSSESNLLKNTDFSGIDFSLSDINNDEISLDGIWYVKPYVNRSESLTIQSYNDSDKGNCLKVSLSKGTIHGLYQKIRYTPGTNMHFKLSFYARSDGASRIRPYISIGGVQFNLGYSFLVGTEWTEISVEDTINVPETGEFIVSLDGGSLGKTVYIADPKCERIFSEAESACNVEMTHLSLAGHLIGENLVAETDFSSVSEKALSGVNNVTELGDSWKINCSVGKNTKLTVAIEDVYNGSLYYELSAAATIRGIFQEIAHKDGQAKIRFSFYARADRGDVPIKPYISSSNTVEKDKGKTFYLSEEWQKIIVEKTFNVSGGKFTVSFDGIAAGSARKVWFAQPEVVELSPKSIAEDFKVLDSVHLNVEYLYDGQIYEAEHDAVIYNISEDGSVITFNDYALLAMFPEDCIAYEAQADGTQLAVPSASEILLTNLEISRTAPDIDFACGCHNKIWGVNKNENVIYASYYNDATNWNFFEGITADSFYGECTTPGKFTGAISYGGYPLFFKERFLVTVFGSDSSEFTLSEKEMRGVEEGSEKSLVCMNEVLYYKSFDGMMRFSGGLPVSINEAFGNEKYHAAVCGADYGKLYVSMLDCQDDPYLFVFDANNSFWHKEDPLRASDFVFSETKLHLVEENSGDFITLDDSESTENIKWFFESGDLYDSSAVKKYIWRLMMRVGMHEHSKIRIYLQYNSSGTWELQKELESSGRKTFSIPLQCKRTDHLKLRIEGCGKITIYSIARRLITGSEI